MAEAQNVPVSVQKRNNEDSEQHISLIVSDTILPKMSNQQKKSNIVLLDFYAALQRDGAIRLDLNIIFNPISVRHGVITRADYYVGSTGVEVSVEAKQGMVLAHIQAATLDINYSNSETINRKSALILTPEIKAKHGGSEVDAKLGSITRDAATESVFAVTFKSQERYLVPTLMGDTVKWTLNLPQGKNIIRNNNR